MNQNEMYSTEEADSSKKTRYPFVVLYHDRIKPILSLTAMGNSLEIRYAAKHQSSTT